jgi:hypothetical protein
MGDEITLHQETEAELIRVSSSAPDVGISYCCVSMPKVVHAAPVCKEKQAQHENRHEKIVLSDHDALLLLFPLTKDTMPLSAEKCCDGRNPCA